MSKQKHDVGNKKRRTAEAQEQNAKAPTTHALAHNLVERGLASKQILDGHSRGRSAGD